MISAKNSLFREQIRRRQIDEKLRARRIELLRQEELSRTFDQNEQILIEARNILHNLKYHNDENNDFERLECLTAFKKHVRKLSSNMLLKLVMQKPYLINLLSEVLEGVNKSGLEWHNKSPFFEQIIKILNHVIELKEVTDQCIMQSRIIEQLIPYLLQHHPKDNVLAALFNFLANATSSSQSLSIYYTRLQLPSILIRLMVSLCPNAQTKYLANFMYFIRSYTEEMRQFNFNHLQAQVILETSLSVTKSAIDANKTEQVYVTLVDSLKVMKQLFNRELIQITHPKIDVELYLEIISQKNYPIEVKKQALFILDHIIFKDGEQNQITNQLVYNKALITRLWSAHEDLRYIVLNILSNLVLNPDYKKYFTDLIYPIRIMLKFYSETKTTFYFIKNYFCSQKFSILSRSDQSMVQMLRELENNSPQTIALEAAIWIGLIKANPHLRPPQKVTSNLMITQVSQLVLMVQNQDHELQYQEQQI